MRRLHVTALSSRTARRLATHEPLGEVRDLSDLLGLKGIRLHHEVLRPGRRGSVAHKHTGREEFAYVLSGHPSVWHEGETVRLSPGEVVAFVPGESGFHMLVNESEADTALLVGSAVPEGEDEVVVLPTAP